MTSSSASSRRVVVVTGATGRQGGALARRLVGDGWVVRGITRKPDGPKARALRRAGVEVVHGDMSNPASLGGFEGAYGVFSVQNPMIDGHEAAVTQGKNVADVAAAFGAQHVVFGSAGPGRPGTGVLHWDLKLEVEEHIRRLGLRLTVLRPLAFMELMTDKAFYPNASTWHVMPKLMAWDRPIPWVAVDDVAAIAAQAFANPDELGGRDIAVAGDLKSLAECRSIWREVMGRPPVRLPMPLWLFERFVGSDLSRMYRWLAANEVEIDLEESRRVHPGILTVHDWLTLRKGGRSKADP